MFKSLSDNIFLIDMAYFGKLWVSVKSLNDIISFKTIVSQLWRISGTDSIKLGGPLIRLKQLNFNFGVRQAHGKQFFCKYDFFPQKKLVSPPEALPSRQPGNAAGFGFVAVFVATPR